MRSTFNLLTAYISLILLVVLAVIYVLGRIARKTGNKRLIIFNKSLRKVHTPLCYAFYAFGLIHGLLSSAPLLSMNIGSLCYFAALLLWLSHMLRRKLPLPFLRLHRILCALCIVMTIWHLVDCAPLILPRIIQSWFVTMPQTAYRDGVYRAESTGYRAHLWVEVTIEDGRITKVEVVEHYEKGKEYYETPIREIPKEIVKKQSTDVEVISGATKTSLGIMEATRLALLNAAQIKPTP